MNSKTIVLSILLVAAIAVAGCTSSVATGDKTLEDGTIIKSDGTMIKIDGTMVKPDGTMIKPDGTIIKSDGTMIQTNDSSQGVMKKDNASMNKTMNESKTMNTTGLEKLATNYYRFDPIAFQEARDAGKVILLDFHANWCPICNAENPVIKDAFNKLNDSDVIGFQIHYNDDETTAVDTAMIQQYQVAYQHTKIVLGVNGTIVTKTLDAFDSARLNAELAKARNA